MRARIDGALTWLASFRLRLFLRAVFLLLMVAVLGLSLTLLQEEKQRGFDAYRLGLEKTRREIVTRLQHPAGQLALLNPDWNAAAARQGRPLVLPFAALDFDDASKVRNAVELAGCLMNLPPQGSLCVAVGNQARAGGFIYLAGSVVTGRLHEHRQGDERFEAAHRMRVVVRYRDQVWAWMAPYEALSPPKSTLAPSSIRERGRLTGYAERVGGQYAFVKPERDFRGWLWQSAACLGPELDAGDGPDCPRSSFFSLRVPVEPLRQLALAPAESAWPPQDLSAYRVEIALLPPGGEQPIFSNVAGSEAGTLRAFDLPPFALDSLQSLLLPGESLSVYRVAAPPITEDLKAPPLAVVRAEVDAQQEASSPWLQRLIRALPVAEPEAQALVLQQVMTSGPQSYRLLLQGDLRGVEAALTTVATRLSWLVAAMLGVIAFAWWVVELALIRRIARLTRRTRGLALSVQTEAPLAHYQLGDLAGPDELGMLASALQQLLERVRAAALRAQLLAEQEKDRWHAVGHEIMSPLQSLLALHAQADDPSQRYLQRMQQAIKILYGSASPSDAISGSDLQVQVIDLAEFVREVAANAGYQDVVALGCEQAVGVQADAYALEDVFGHLLNNADRFRTPGTAIQLQLTHDDGTVQVRVSNQGPPIPPAMSTKIFEYGVSGSEPADDGGHRGQGLFVVKTYLAKMGAKVHVEPDERGAVFVLTWLKVALLHDESR